tara:strand:+ start:432 stop:632 length:201 start_codon:yes stop_codon:yes gene_type:complete
MSQKSLQDKLNELESIVESFESQDLTVEQALKQFEQGNLIAEQAQKDIDELKVKISVLKKRFDSPE